MTDFYVVYLFVYYFVLTTDKHFWSLAEVNAQHVYRDVFNEYNAEVIPENATVISGEAFTLGRNAPHFSQVKLPDDCVTDPGMCLQTGLTIAMWVKRKGELLLGNLKSVITKIITLSEK